MGGNFALSGGTAFTGAGTVRFPFGNAVVNAAITTDSNTIVEITGNGQISGTAALTVGTLNCKGGTIVGTGTDLAHSLNIIAASNLNITNTFTLDGATLTNRSTTGAWNTGSQTVYGKNGAVINNYNAAIITLADNEYFLQQGSSAAPTFVNDGKLVLKSGGAASLHLSAFQQSSTGILDLEIGGASIYDQVVVSGPVTLGGTLKETSINNYTPPTSATFPVVTFTTPTTTPPHVNGTFSKVTNTSLQLRPVYSNTAVTMGYNHPPVFSTPTLSLSTNENQAISGTLAATDSDGDPLIYSLQIPPQHGTVVLTSTPGTFTYTPATDWFGTDSFSIMADDGYNPTTATASVTVNFVNQAPSFTAGANQEVSDQSAISVAGWATNIKQGPPSEPAQNPTFTVTSDRPNLFVAPAPNVPSGQPAIDPIGTLTFTPVIGAFGTTTVTVTLDDHGGTANGGAELSAPQTFTITIHAIPVATPDAYTVNQYDTLIVDTDNGVLHNDTDNEDTDYTAVLNTPPAHGTLTLDPQGSFIYTPNDDFFSANIDDVDNFTYHVSGHYYDSDPVTVSITVNFVNMPPTFTVGANQEVSDQDAVTVASWATNITKGPMYEPDQVLTFTTTADQPGLFDVQPAINYTTGSSADLTYTPQKGQFGTTTVTVTLQDDGGTENGGVDTFQQTFTIIIHAKPVAVPDAYTVNQYDTLSVDVDSGVLQNDTDLEDTDYTAVLDASPAHGTLTLDPLGSLIYTPNDDFFSVNVDDVDTFTYHISGYYYDSDPVSVSITVNFVNMPPTFNAGANQEVSDQHAVTVAGWATGITWGPMYEPPQVLTFTATADLPGLFDVQPAINYTTGSTADLTYTPKKGQFGTTTVTVTLRDDGGTDNGGVDTLQQSFTIIVHAQPVAIAQSYTAYQNKILSIPATTGVLNNVTHVEEPVLTAALVVVPDQPAHGTVVLNPDGSFEYTPDHDYITGDDAPDSFTYIAKGIIDSDPATVTITIEAVNQPPSFQTGPDISVLMNSGAQLLEGWATEISAGPPDEADQTVHFVILANTNSDLFDPLDSPAISPTGDLTFTPAMNASGSAIITVMLFDNGGTDLDGVDYSDPQTFAITITQPEDPAVEAGKMFVSRLDATGLDATPDSFPKIALAMNPRAGTVSEPLIQIDYQQVNGVQTLPQLYGTVGTTPFDPNNPTSNVWQFTAVPASDDTGTHTASWDVGRGQIIYMSDSGDTIQVQFPPGRHFPKLSMVTLDDEDNEVVLGTAELHSIVVANQPTDSVAPVGAAVDTPEGTPFMLRAVNSSGLQVNARASITGPAGGRISLDGYPQNEYRVLADQPVDLPQVVSVDGTGYVTMYLQNYGATGTATLNVEGQTYIEDKNSTLMWSPLGGASAPVVAQWQATDEETFNVIKIPFETIYQLEIASGNWSGVDDQLTQNWAIEIAANQTSVKLLDPSGLPNIVPLQEIGNASPGMRRFPFTKTLAVLGCYNENQIASLTVVTGNGAKAPRLDFGLLTIPLVMSQQINTPVYGNWAAPRHSYGLLGHSGSLIALDGNNMLVNENGQPRNFDFAKFDWEVVQNDPANRISVNFVGAVAGKPELQIQGWRPGTATFKPHIPGELLEAQTDLGSWDVFSHNPTLHMPNLTQVNTAVNNASFANENSQFYGEIPIDSPGQYLPWANAKLPSLITPTLTAPVSNNLRLLEAFRRRSMYILSQLTDRTSLTPFDDEINVNGTTATLLWSNRNDIGFTKSQATALVAVAKTQADTFEPAVSNPLFHLGPLQNIIHRLRTYSTPQANNSDIFNPLRTYARSLVDSGLLTIIKQGASVKWDPTNYATMAGRNIQVLPPIPITYMSRRPGDNMLRTQWHNRDYLENELDPTGSAITQVFIDAGVPNWHLANPNTRDLLKHIHAERKDLAIGMIKQRGAANVRLQANVTLFDVYTIFGYWVNVTINDDFSWQTDHFWAVGTGLYMSGPSIFNSETATFHEDGKAPYTKSADTQHYLSDFRAIDTSNPYDDSIAGTLSEALHVVDVFRILSLNKVQAWQDWQVALGAWAGSDAVGTVAVHMLWLGTYFGMDNLYGAEIGEDLVTGEPLSFTQRLICAAMAAVDIGTNVVPLGEGVVRVTKGLATSLAKQAVEDAANVVTHEILDEAAVFAGNAAKASTKTPNFLTTVTENRLGTNAAAFEKTVAAESAGVFEEKVGLKMSTSNSSLATNLPLSDSAQHTVLRVADDVATNEAARAISASEVRALKETMSAEELSGGAVREYFENACFTAGTLVTMHNLNYKAIDRIQPGDRVLSRDQDGGGGLVESVVARVFERKSDHIRTLAIRRLPSARPRAVHSQERRDASENEDAGSDDDSSTVGTIQTTNEHPFCVVGHGWTAAKELQPGDLLLLSDGGIATCDSNVYYPGIQTVYNLEIRTTHTYFVGDARVWVHNLCEGEKKFHDFLKKSGANCGIPLPVPAASLTDAQLKNLYKTYVLQMTSTSGRFKAQFRGFLRETIHENTKRFYAKAGIATPGGMWYGHHLCPCEFEDDFFAAGINIHDPQYSIALNFTDHMAPHPQFNDAWRAFFRQHPPGTVGRADIIIEGKRLLTQSQWAPWQREVKRLGIVSAFH